MYNCCSVYNPPGGSAGAVIGSGTLNYYAKWTPDGTTLGIGQTYDNGTNVAVGHTSPTYYFDVIKTQNANTTISVANLNASTASRAGYLAISEDNALATYAYSSGFSNTYLANNVAIYASKRVMRFAADADGAGSGSFTWSVGGFASVATQKMELTAAGYLGIGITPPTHMLHVAASGVNAALIEAAATYNGLQINGGGATSATYSLQIQNTTPSTIFAVRNDGFVGIGTGTPSVNLDIVGQGSNRPFATIRPSQSQISWGWGLYDHNNIYKGGIFAGDSGTYVNQVMVSSANGNILRFETDAEVATGGTTKMMWKIGGYNEVNIMELHSNTLRIGKDGGWSAPAARVAILGSTTATEFGISIADSSAVNILSTTNSGSVIGKASLATNAVDGFWYVPSCAGAPTGTPTTQSGTIPMVADSTNNKLYIYSGGAWVALN
jgi:hypothetical protein